MMTLSAKKKIRLELNSLRGSLLSSRRDEAKSSLLSTLYPELDAYRLVCSFHSMGSEIDTSALNELLAARGRLVLPKIENQKLDFFLVTDLEEELSRCSSYFNLYEPIPEICTKMHLEEIDCVLVPALGFDHNQRRIGYGKGYYDRLIAQAKAASLSTQFLGIGFHEQMQLQTLPAEQHDMTLDRIHLF
jgi:5-formyltetrahydrofolate cyclo-ligase